MHWAIVMHAKPPLPYDISTYNIRLPTICAPGVRCCRVQKPLKPACLIDAIREGKVCTVCWRRPVASAGSSARDGAAQNHVCYGHSVDFHARGAIQGIPKRGQALAAVNSWSNVTGLQSNFGQNRDNTQTKNTVVHTRG